MQQAIGDDLTADQLAYINRAVTPMHICGGGVSANGWYPQLIAGVSSGAHKPSAADIFMDPDTGTVLEVATGDVNPMVVVVETCTGYRMGSDVGVAPSSQ
jgi:hypothetical protein